MEEAKRLEDICEEDPSNATPRTQLGNLYFDAEHYDLSDQVVHEALEARSRPTRTSAPTSGVSYYYQNQPDSALTQFAHSLEIEPEAHEDDAESGHRARVRQAGSRRRAKAWQRVVDLAPDSPEGQAARQRAGQRQVRTPEPERPRPRPAQTEGPYVLIRLLLFLLLVLLCCGRAVWRLLPRGRRRRHRAPVRAVTGPRSAARGWCATRSAAPSWYSRAR